MSISGRRIFLTQGRYTGEGYAVFNSSGIWDWYAAGAPLRVDLLLVGGGGSAGVTRATGAGPYPNFLSPPQLGGGGGAGQILVYENIPVFGNIPITVGVGGEHFSTGGGLGNWVYLYPRGGGSTVVATPTRTYVARGGGNGGGATRYITGSSIPETLERVGDATGASGGGAAGAGGGAGGGIIYSAGGGNGPDIFPATSGTPSAGGYGAGYGASGQGISPEEVGFGDVPGLPSVLGAGGWRRGGSVVGAGSGGVNNRGSNGLVVIKWKAQ